MSEILRSIAAYVPLHVARAALLAESPQILTEPLINNISAAILYADISGFTPLTEMLAKKGAEGPEELTRLLNRYFSWMIAFVEAEGGQVVKFGGDALAVIFPAIDEPLALATRRALQAAATMQTAMEEFGIMESSAGLIYLQMKLGIGAGELIEAHIGGVSNRWEYIIAGDALFQATRAERSAQKGEVILSPEAVAVLHPVQIPPKTLKPLKWDQVKQPEAVQAVLRCYVPKPVLTWLDQEFHSWLATLRPMSVLFAGIDGLDYTRGETIERLHHFTRSVQEAIYHFGGSMPRLTVDDKGTVLLALFGTPPYSHEDDPERAVRCAFRLQQAAQAHNLQLATGIATGWVFAGPVGGFTRREYTVMGDAVNLAARLMGVAGPGQIVCNYGTYRSTYGQIEFASLPALTVKGKSDPIRVYQPIKGRRSGQYFDTLHQSADIMPLVGRQTELSQLAAYITALQAGAGQVVIIEGEAGIGKSQLVGEFLKFATASSITPLLGRGRSVDPTTPLRAWHDIFSTFFGETAREADVLKYIARNAPGLIQYLPLLNDIFPFQIRETGLTLSYTAEHRQRILSRMLLMLLIGRAKIEPLALIFEDAQWLDAPSRGLIMHAAQAIQHQNIPVLLLLVTRPLEDSTARTTANALAIMGKTATLRLSPLLPEEVLTLVAGPLGLTSHELPETVAELLRDRAGGNPFFAEEIFYTLHQQGFVTFKSMQNKTRCLVTGDFSRAAQTLPATLQNVILARLDRLPPEKQLLLKIGAVIGQTFAYSTLRDTLREYLDFTEAELHHHFDELGYLGFITLVTDDPVRAYTFNHIIIREVIYQSLLFDRRRQLHATVARWYEDAYTPDTSERLATLDAGRPQSSTVIQNIPSNDSPLASYYSLLVYHWHQAENAEKERLYAALLGEQALVQYANAEALGYLGRALELTPPDHLYDRFKLLLARQTVYDRRGDRERQAVDLTALLELVNQAQKPAWRATANYSLAAFNLATAKYTQAIIAAETALGFARQVQNISLECEIYGVWAGAAKRLGDLAQAKNLLLKARKLAKEHQLAFVEAEILNQIAALYYLQGKYNQAQALARQSLGVAQTYKGLLLQAENLCVLGEISYYTQQFDNASSSFEQAVPVYFATGVVRDQFLPMGFIGKLRLISGDYEAARDYFEQAFDIAIDTGDEAGSARALCWVGMVYHALGDYSTAQSYVGQALGLQKELGHLPGQANSLSQFARIYYGIGDNRITKRYCDLALELLRDVYVPGIAGATYTILGHALTRMGKFDAAEKAYHQAIDIHQVTAQPEKAIHPTVGLAVVYLARHNVNAATELIDSILPMFKASQPPLFSDLLWVYLKLIFILQAVGRSQQAQKFLATAYQILQHRAANFTDNALRHKYLTWVKEHRDITSLWQGDDPHINKPVHGQAQTKERYLE